MSESESRRRRSWTSLPDPIPTVQTFLAKHRIPDSYCLCAWSYYITQRAANTMKVLLREIQLVKPRWFTVGVCPFNALHVYSRLFIDEATQSSQDTPLFCNSITFTSIVCRLSVSNFNILQALHAFDAFHRFARFPSVMSSTSKPRVNRQESDLSTLMHTHRIRLRHLVSISHPRAAFPMEVYDVSLVDDSNPNLGKRSRQMKDNRCSATRLF